MRSLRIILILAGKQLRILSRMPAILLVIFLPGIVMYSVFTKIFEGPAGVSRPFRVAVVDQDDSEESRRLIEALGKSKVKIIRTEDETDNGPLLTAESARHQIRRKGNYRVAVVIPPGFGEAPDVFAGDRHEGVELIFDETQPMEANVILGLLQMAAGRRLFEKASGLFKRGASQSGSGAQGEQGELIRVTKTGVAIQRMKIASKHTFLAGIVPMFLLFGATGAARGLIEEIHSGEIARLLVAPIAPAHLVIGNMLSALVVSMLQCYGMYIFAWLVFGVGIWGIAGGLFVLTLMTTSATTAFGMLLGSLCRTTQQLDSIGTIVILAMSAIGGSMVPRFVMPPFMQKMGLFTINGWSYDGFIALIRNEGFGLRALMSGGDVQGIWLPCLVLILIAAGCASTGSILLTRRLRAGPGD
jgi:ABC-2 type transport system permease protein